MYTPGYHRWEDRDAALRFVARYNFGELITVVGGAPLVTHLPFLVDETRNVLRAHFARANPHGSHVEGGEHLAVFSGPHAYISPDWYGAAGAKDVPTWNYLAVHVRGRGRVVSDAPKVDEFLADLAAYEEGRRYDLERGGRIWTMAKVPPEKHERLRAGIVAFEIDIETVDAKAKLSQNKPGEVITGVVRALSESGSQMSVAVAQAMSAVTKRG